MSIHFDVNKLIEERERLKRRIDALERYTTDFYSFMETHHQMTADLQELKKIMRELIKALDALGTLPPDLSKLVEAAKGQLRSKR